MQRLGFGSICTLFRVMTVLEIKTVFGTTLHCNAWREVHSIMDPIPGSSWILFLGSWFQILISVPLLLTLWPAINVPHRSRKMTFPRSPLKYRLSDVLRGRTYNVSASSSLMFHLLSFSFFQDGLKTADKLKQYIEKLAADLYNVNNLLYKSRLLFMFTLDVWDWLPHSGGLHWNMPTPP